MRNAAAELAEIFGLWNAEPGNSNRSIRDYRTKVAADAELTLIEHIEHAFTLYAECLRDIEILKSSGVVVAQYEGLRDPWANAIIMPDAAWGGSGTARQDCIRNSDLRLLMALSAQVQQHRDSGSTLQPNLEAVRSFLDEVQDLLVDGDLPNELRQLIEQVVDGVETALAAGDWHAIASSIRELIAALSLVAAAGEDTSWGKRASAIAREICVGVVANAVVQLGTYTSIGLIAGA